MSAPVRFMARERPLSRHRQRGIAVIMASGIYIATHQHLSERQQRAELQESTPGA